MQDNSGELLPGMGTDHGYPTMDDQGNYKAAS